MRSSFLKRAVACSGALATTLTGAVVLTAAPASAATVVTDYGFAGTAFGTRVVSSSVSLSTGRTAHAWISCTRVAGLDGSNRPQASNFLAAADAPQNNPWIDFGTMESANRTFRQKDKGLVGVASVNKLSSVTLKGPETAEGAPGPFFHLEGLTTRSTAVARKGALDADSTFTSTDLRIELPTGTPVDEPLSELLGALDGGIGSVIETLKQAQGNEIEIPGLGVVRPGAKTRSVGKNVATSSAYALQVQLFGQDGARGTGDDSTITMGKTRARIMRDLPAGVMNGYGYGADIVLADGLAKIGETGIQPLDCRGTGGKTVSDYAPASHDLLGGILDIGAMRGAVNGNQHGDGTGDAWTMGQVNNLSLGEGDQHVQMTGIVGKANVRKKASGEIVRSIAGTGVGSLTIGSDTYGASEIPNRPILVDGLGKIEFNVATFFKRGVRVTAVRITLDPGESTQTVINLGNARAILQPY